MGKSVYTAVVKKIVDYNLALGTHLNSWFIKRSIFKIVTNNPLTCRGEYLYCYENNAFEFDCQ
jgi:hypothetical protein